jgi:predicted glycosyltransferase
MNRLRGAPIAFDIAHPKHFHQFRPVVERLAQSHSVHIIARDKDVVLRLLQEAGIPFESYGRHRHGLAAKLVGAPATLLQYGALLRKVQPRLVVSKSSPYAAVLGRAFGITTVIMPDSEGVAINERVVIPLADHVITPASFERDYGLRHHRVKGFFEAGYLHPRYFRPDPAALEPLGLAGGQPFAVLRFVSWGASHDVRQSGLADQHKLRMVRELSRYARVLVSAEGPLPSEIQAARLTAPASRIHDILAHATLYLGDSQTMATEAALLGTPAVRCNSFVGASDFSNFRILEREFELLHNISSPEDALRRAVSLVVDPEAKRRWQRRRERYFSTVGDVITEITGFLQQIMEADRASRG